VNPGFLQYRKSVAEDFAAIEWRDGPAGGSVVIDSRGVEYIDCLGGFGIFNCGRSHPVIVEAVERQIRKQSLHSQELLDPLRSYCAALLAKTLPGDLQYAFFTNSGAESVEAALKFAMVSTGRRHFLGVIGAFHGKTLGALSGTSKAVFRKPFSGSLLPFNHLPVNDVEALRRAFESSKFTGNEIAGFLVEPIMGEGGIHVCSDEYLRAARALCDEYGACLIFDEVQSGMGRSGKWWACQHSGVAPDIIAIGKAFGGGVMPAGATVGTAKVWTKYLENPFLFTTTFGGCPAAMAGAIAAMHVIETEGLCDRATEMGNLFMTELRKLAVEYPHILREVRGRGLMIGLQFPNDEIGYRFSRGAFGKHVLLAGTLVNSRVIRVEPPLTITREQVLEVVARFTAVLQEMTAAGEGVPVAPVIAAPAAGIKSPNKLVVAVAPAVALPAPATVHGLFSPPPVSARRERLDSDEHELPTALVLNAIVRTRSVPDTTVIAEAPSRDRSISAVSSDTDVSSVSTSSEEEDERRFDPRPTGTGPILASPHAASKPRA
jgi:putrescine aminotransferase